MPEGTLPASRVKKFRIHAARHDFDIAEPLMGEEQAGVLGRDEGIAGGVMQLPQIAQQEGTEHAQMVA